MKLIFLKGNMKKFYGSDIISIAIIFVFINNQWYHSPVFGCSFLIEDQHGVARKFKAAYEEGVKAAVGQRGQHAVRIFNAVFNHVVSG